MKRSTPRRPRPAVTLGLAACIVAILAGNLYVLREGSRTTPVELGDAVARFRASSGATPADATAQSSPLIAAPTSTAHEVAAAREQSRGSSTHASKVEGPAPGTLADDPEQPDELPPAGVYTYATEGGERISLGGAARTYPDRTYASVRHLGGCRWEHHSEVVEEHVDRREMCVGAGQLLQHVQERQVTFFGQTDGATVTCDPPQVQHTAGDEPGATTTAHCSDGEGTDVTIVRTLLAELEVAVGGDTVRAIHLRLDSTMTGRMEGTAVDEMWIWARNGLPLRWDRRVDTVAETAFGPHVRYQEEASFRLASLTPTS